MGTGISGILSLIAKLYKPVTNIDLSHGKVKVGGVDIQLIGRKCIKL
jgi:hypothetical protein